MWLSSKGWTTYQHIMIKREKEIRKSAEPKIINEEKVELKPFKLGNNLPVHYDEEALKSSPILEPAVMTFPATFKMERKKNDDKPGIDLLTRQLQLVHERRSNNSSSKSKSTPSIGCKDSLPYKKATIAGKDTRASLSEFTSSKKKDAVNNHETNVCSDLLPTPDIFDEEMGTNLRVNPTTIKSDSLNNHNFKATESRSSELSAFYQKANQRTNSSNSNSDGIKENDAGSILFQSPQKSSSSGGMRKVVTKKQAAKVANPYDIDQMNEHLASHTDILIDYK